MPRRPRRRMPTGPVAALHLAAVGLALLAVASSCGTEAPSQTPPAPTLFTVGVPVSESVDAHAMVYGTFVATSSTHTIALSALSSDYGWSLFGGPSYTSGVLIYRCDLFADASDESCTPPPLIAGRTYYLRIDEEVGVAGSFTLTIS
jgi:hypothetical protein